MTLRGFDVWLHGFTANVDGVQALVRLFQLDPRVAKQLVASLPRAVKRDLAIVDAQRLVDALAAIGGQAEVRVRPLQPARVMLVGEAAAQPEQATVIGAPRVSHAPIARDTGATVKLGTHDLAAYYAPQPAAAAAPPTISVPPPAPVAVSIPAPAPAPATVHASIPAPVRLVASIPAPVAVPMNLELEQRIPPVWQSPASAPQVEDAWHQSLRLPASEAPGAASALQNLRKPSERARPPRRRASSVAPSTSSRPRSQAPTAPRRNPEAGFLLVLTGTTLVFTALLAAL